MMLDSEEIIDKLKSILGYKTDLELADLLSIKPNTLASWKARGKVRYERIIKIAIRLKIDLNEIFLSNPKSIVNGSLVSRMVKMVSSDHLIEYFLDPKKCLAKSPSCYFPTEEKIDIAFQMAVENMSPTIKVNSYLLCQKIIIKDLKPWHIYLIVIEDRGVLCYRFKRFDESGSLVFISDNSNYDSITVEAKKVREIYSLKGIFLPTTKYLV